MTGSITHTLVELGPQNRPSVVQWLTGAARRILIGPATAAVQGSGDDYDEFVRIEEHGPKYITFSDVTQIDNAVKNFSWRRGIAYEFGYHVCLVTPHLLRAFCMKLSTMMSSSGFQVGFDNSADNVYTVYLENMASSDPRDIEVAREEVARANDQRLYIGTGSVWDRVARETTQALFGNIRFNDLPESGLSDPLRIQEYAVCHCPDRIEQWMLSYRQRLEKEPEARELIGHWNLLENGVTFWLDANPSERVCGINAAEAGGFGKAEEEVLLHKQPLQGFENYFNIRYAPGVKPCEPPKPQQRRAKSTPSTIYDQYPGLARLIPLTEVLFPSLSHLEIRSNGSSLFRSDDDDEDNSRITISAICTCCARVMPDLTAEDIVLLADPDHTKEIRGNLARRYRRPFHPCCYEAMMNPVSVDVPNYDPELYNINPHLPPPSSDMRAVIHTRARTQSPMLPVARLIYSSRTGFNVGVDIPATRMYALKTKIIPVNLKDYMIMARNPGGFVDKMLCYTYNDSDVRELCSPPTAPIHPPSEIVLS